MINKNLQQYIETKVLPVYDKNEQGHGPKHIKYVVRRSLKFAEQAPDINYDMVYTVASYHDIGHHIDAKNHEQVSAQMLLDDKNLQQFFDDNQIVIMAQAVEDHRASSDLEPRSVYGKIVSSADRRTDINNVLTTMYTYSLKNNPQFTLEQNIENAYQHICRKFARGGYATTKMYFKDEEYENMLNQADYFATHKDEFVRRYLEINNVKTVDDSLQN